MTFDSKMPQQNEKISVVTAYMHQQNPLMMIYQQREKDDIGLVELDLPWLIMLSWQGHNTSLFENKLQYVQRFSNLADTGRINCK